MLASLFRARSWARAHILHLGLACLVVGVPLVVGARATEAHDEARYAASARFSERADITAGLTRAVFTSLGNSGRAVMQRRYGGDSGLAGRLRTEPGAELFGYRVILDARGRRLASQGQAPARLSTGRPGGPALSDLLRFPSGEVVEWAVPFADHRGRARMLVSGMTVAAVRAFLTDYLRGLSIGDRSRLVLADASGATLAVRNGAAFSPDQRLPEGMVATWARVPGTSWKLGLMVPDAHVYAGVGTHSWLPWALLAALTLAGLAALVLLTRLQRSVAVTRTVNSELADSREEWKSLVTALEEGVARKTRDGRVELLNESARRLLGVEEAVIGPAPYPFTFLDEDGSPVLAEQTPPSQALATGLPSSRVVGLQRPGAPRRWLTVSARPLKHEGDTEPYATVFSLADITAQRELELHLTNLAEHDPLTGLPNRRRFEDDLGRQIARCRRYGEPAALLMLDIDGFKTVNDSLGHVAGDEVLRSVAFAIRDRLRGGDSVGRIGGDEFAILLVHADADQAAAYAHQLEERVAASVTADMPEVSIEISVGVAPLGGSIVSVPEALDAADRAMYLRKHSEGTAVPRHLPPALAPVVQPEVPSTISALLAAVQARDTETASHSREVVVLAHRVACELGVDGRVLREVEQVALLHDLGKLAMPDAILFKPGPLDDHEMRLMRKHPAAGAQIVRSVHALRHLAPALRACHERWDGAGYPDGVAGEAIPLAARITFVCDAFNAMTTDRVYRRAMTPAQARAEVERCAGSQFCPECAAALLAVLDRQESSISSIR